MAKVTPIRITEQFEHFIGELKDTFWGDVNGQSRLCLKNWLEQDSLQQRDRYIRDSGRDSASPEKIYRNGFYERDWVTRFGTIRLRIARTRTKNFLPSALHAFQRRADEVALLIREAFLRGISTRQVGRIVATFTGEPVSAQTVSRLTRSLDQAVEAFHQAPLEDEWAYLFLDGVSLRMRRPGSRKRVHMLVAYGVKTDGTRQLLAFLRSQGESQHDWEGLLRDLQQRGISTKKLQMIITDGCPGLAAAIKALYPRVLHQRCWVHKMRNLVNGVRKKDQEAVATGARAIYRAANRPEAEEPFRQFKKRWSEYYPACCGSWKKISRSC